MKSSKEYKEEADGYAEKMKAYFEDAQKAWNQGDKAEAKNLSNKGNEFKALLAETNKKYQSAIESEKEALKKMHLTKTAVSEVAFVNNFKEKLNIEGDDDGEEDPDVLNEKYREKSAQYGQLMKEAFENSQKAWKSGDKQKAKEYSDLGYEYREKMQTYNSYAVKIVASAKNIQRESDEIDLHGLYVEEALQFFTETIKKKLYGKEIDTLKVITGKGLHSKDGPKIKKNIIDFCLKNNLNVEEDKTNEGCLLISLKNYLN